MSCFKWRHCTEVSSPFDLEGVCQVGGEGGRGQEIFMALLSP